jgi:hypothetical protein
MLSRATDATGDAFVRHVDAYQLGRPVAGDDLDVLSFCVVGAVVDAVVSSPRTCVVVVSLVDACSFSLSGFGLDFLRLGPMITAKFEDAHANFYSIRMYSHIRYARQTKCPGGWRCVDSEVPQ